MPRNVFHRKYTIAIIPVENLAVLRNKNEDIDILKIIIRSYYCTYSSQTVNIQAKLPEATTMGAASAALNLAVPKISHSDAKWPRATT